MTADWNEGYEAAVRLYYPEYRSKPLSKEEIEELLHLFEIDPANTKYQEGFQVALQELRKRS